MDKSTVEKLKETYNSDIIKTYEEKFENNLSEWSIEEAKQFINDFSLLENQKKELQNDFEIVLVEKTKDKKTSRMANIAKFALITPINFAMLYAGFQIVDNPSINTATRLIASAALILVSSHGRLGLATDNYHELFGEIITPKPFPQKTLKKGSN